MIEELLTIEEYAGPHAGSPDWTPERVKHAEELCRRVNALAVEMQEQGIYFPVNPSTGSRVSGKTFGGFRPQDCPQGAPHSAHKEGQAVDLYDRLGELDEWLSANESALERHDLYREHPDSTGGWLHLSTRAPPSGRRTFFP